jgi:hypothetical protein
LGRGFSNPRLRYLENVSSATSFSGTRVGKPALRYTELREDLPQGLVGFLGLGFDGIEFRDDLSDGPVGFGVAGVDVAAWGRCCSRFSSAPRDRRCG